MFSLPFGFGEKVPDQFVELGGAFEVNGVTGFRDAHETAAGKAASGEMDRLWRNDDVFFSGQAEHGHVERRECFRRGSAQLTELTAKGVLFEANGQVVDLPIEAVKARLLVRHAFASGRVHAAFEEALLTPTRLGGVNRRKRRVSESAGGVAHHEGFHAFGTLQGVGEAGPASHRLCNEPYFLEAEVVDERCQIGCESGRSRASWLLAGRCEAAVTENDTGVAVFERGKLLPPAQVVSAEAMREHQRRSGAGHFVIDAGARDFEKWHGAQSTDLEHGDTEDREFRPGSRMLSWSSGELVSCTDHSVNSQKAPVPSVSPCFNLPVNATNSRHLC
jgi:hypothetical protein